MHRSFAKNWWTTPDFAQVRAPRGGAGGQRKVLAGLPLTVGRCNYGVAAFLCATTISQDQIDLLGRNATLLTQK
jgi:hypothetical protein